jgi:hypothetical protein
VIVTTGKVIKIDEGKFHFERNSETPGIVMVYGGSSSDREQLTLPVNVQEMDNFIAAYQRAASEDVGYRKTENEFKTPDIGRKP